MLRSIVPIWRSKSSLIRAVAAVEGEDCEALLGSPHTNAGVASEHAVAPRAAAPLFRKSRRAVFFAVIGDLQLKRFAKERELSAVHAPISTNTIYRANVYSSTPESAVELCCPACRLSRRDAIRARRI